MAKAKKTKTVKTAKKGKAIKATKAKVAKTKKKTAKTAKASKTLKKSAAKKPAKRAKNAMKKGKSTKAKKVLTTPKGYHSVTPYLIVKEGMDAIEFYKKVFGAKMVMCMPKEDGKIGHAELIIGDAKIMLADESPESHVMSPQPGQTSPVGIHVYLKDVDAVVERALAEGATLTRPVEDMYYGDRSGALEDPFGHSWYVATHIEDVTPAKMKKRMAEMQDKKSY